MILALTMVSPCRYAFDVDPISHAFKNRRVLAYVDAGVPDGIQVDTNGNVYSGTGDGVQVCWLSLSPSTVVVLWLKYSRIFSTDMELRGNAAREILLGHHFRQHGFRWKRTAC